LMWSKYFNKTSIVASCEDEDIGIVSGFLFPDSPDTLFVWQVAVDPKFRGHGLATKLINQLIQQLDKIDEVKYLKATVTTSNVSAKTNSLIQTMKLNSPTVSVLSNKRIMISKYILWRFYSPMTATTQNAKIDMNIIEAHESGGRSYSRTWPTVFNQAKG